MDRHHGLGLGLILVIAALGLAGCLDVDNGGAMQGGGTDASADDGGLGPLPDSASGSVPGAEAGVPAVTIGGDAAGATLDFGLLDCGGAAPAAKTFTVMNTGTAKVHYALGLSTTDAFSIDGAT